MYSKIGAMLRGQKRHISFHTPGHKQAGDDITELSYSDNAFSPHGVILQAEQQTADILGAARTFFLTGGSTCGVHAMLYALQTKGVKRIALSPFSHPSVKNGCRVLGLEQVLFPARVKAGIPQQPTPEEMENALKEADALLLTSPDYYGFFPDLKAARALCSEEGKPLVIDGAHGSHLHFTERHAGKYADLWVDGAHKSLPALTQGAAVSCKKTAWEDALFEGVKTFHTTSPSYPILCSVEEAFLLPRNEKTERACEALKREAGAVENEDWTKILIPFGKNSAAVQQFLEAHGVYPEFNDGNYIMFYASPCTKISELKKLEKLLRGLPRETISDGETQEGAVRGQTELVALEQAIGRTCAEECGIFPPSLPVIRRGERVAQDAVRRLQQATHTFGLAQGKITVYRE